MADGKIIILNGTHRSGKTSIVKVLQITQDEPYLNTGAENRYQRSLLSPRVWDQAGLLRVGD